MSTLHAFRGPAHTGALRGDPDVVFDAMKDANALCVYRWSRPLAAYLIREPKFADVLAVLDLAGHRVVWHGAPPELDELKPPTEPEQLTLGGGAL